MKTPSFNELIKSRLFAAGAVFFGVNCTYSYLFYQVNSFKIFLILCGVSLLAIWNDLVFQKNTDRKIPWKQILISSIPLLATLPGLILYQGAYNYNFRYELTSNLVLIIWIAYLYRLVKSDEDLSPFFYLIGITILYVGVWAFLEKLGFHPLKWGAAPASRVKSTFGNINYFAGFLVVVTPLFFAFSLPDKLSDFTSIASLKSGFRKNGLFYPTVFLVAAISLILTFTRAAQAATIASLIMVLFFFAYSSVSETWRKRLLWIFFFATVFSILVLVLLVVFSENLPVNRYTRLLTLQGWVSRFSGWIPALNSIEASPWIGYGLGSSYNLYFRFADPNARLLFEQHSYNHVHSEPLEYIQEAGILGFIIFLVFWIYLAIILLKTIASKESNLLLRKLALGVLGGFIGYHLHGLFSVAPRMMVMKLPLFTLIALTFIIQKLAASVKEEEVERGFVERLKAFAPGLVGLGFLWIIFSPWLIGQYEYVSIQRQRPSLLKVEKLEKMVERYQDVYALDYLSHLQIQYKRSKQLEKTIKYIDETLPGYREIGHSKTVLAIMQRDYAKAKILGLTYQNEQDRYYKPTIYLLMGLSLDTDDFGLFKSQFQLLVRNLIFKSRVYYDLDADKVQIPIEEMNTAFQVVENEEGLVFRWNEKMIRNFFEIGKKTRTKKSYTMKDKNGFLSYLAHHFSNHPYFKINVKPEYKETESGQVRKELQAYFSSAAGMQKALAQLSKKQKSQLARTPASQRNQVIYQHRKETEELRTKYKAQMDNSAAFLRTRADWGKYLRKQKFTGNFIRELSNVLFPARNKR